MSGDPEPATATGPADWASGESGIVAGVRLGVRTRAEDALLDARRWATLQPLRLARAARRRPPQPARARARDRARRRAEPAGRRARRARALAPRGRVRHGRRRRARQVREPQRAAGGAPAAGHDWLLVIDDDVALPRGFLDAFLFLAERFDLRARAARAPRRSHAAWQVTRRRAGSVVRETRVRRDRPGHRVPPRHVRRRCCRSRPLRMGWGLDLALVGAGARARLADRRRRRHPDPPRPAADRRLLRPRRGDGGGARRSSRTARTCTRDRGAADAGDAPRWTVMRVAIVAEYYPRAGDPVLGVWAHRQALAARDAGAEVRVLVLHRPVPPLRGAARARRARRARRACASRGAPSSTASTSPTCATSRRRGRGATARGARGRRRRWRCALRRLRAAFPFDLVHAHYAVPAGDAVRRAPRATSRSSSRSTAATCSRPRRACGRRARRPARVRARARLVLANSAGTEARCQALGARATPRRAPRHRRAAERRRARRRRPPTLVTVGHLVARKRHADVIAALALLRDAPPGAPLRDRRRRARARAARRGSRRARRAPTASSSAASSRTPTRARAPPQAARCSCCRASTRRSASPTSRRWPPASRRSAAGARTGRRRSRAAGGGIELVPPRDPRGARRPDRPPADGRRGPRALGRRARSTVERAFTWELCGRQTVAAYERALTDRFPARSRG